MFTRSITVGLLDTNCYLVTCMETSETIVIDPGFMENETESFLGEIAKRGLEVRYIVNTHGHIDHISGNGVLKRATGASILIHEKDAGMLIDASADRLLHDGDIIKVGMLELKVIHTPGHSGGSISLYCQRENIVFTGDTLFAGSIGRTDLPGSSFEEITKSLCKLIKMPDQTIVYPGHGEKTTIGKEKAENPFLSLRGEPFRG